MIEFVNCLIQSGQGWLCQQRSAGGPVEHISVFKYQQQTLRPVLIISCDALNRHFFHGHIPHLSFEYPPCLLSGLPHGWREIDRSPALRTRVGWIPAFRPFRIPLVIPRPALPGFLEQQQLDHVVLERARTLQLSPQRTLSPTHGLP